MNDTLNLLLTRRSVPPQLLAAPGPDEDELYTLLTIASRVPDHGKLVPWRFVVIAGEARERVGKMIEAVYLANNPGADAERLATERGRMSRAPVVVAVVSRAKPHIKIPEWEQILSAGAACMNLSVAANAAGYGTAWLTEWYAFDRRFLTAFGLQEHERIAGFVHIGTRPEPQADRTRPDLEEIVTWL